MHDAVEMKKLRHATKHGIIGAKNGQLNQFNYR